METQKVYEKIEQNNVHLTRVAPFVLESTKRIFDYNHGQQWRYSYELAACGAELKGDRWDLSWVWSLDSRLHATDEWSGPARPRNRIALDGRSWLRFVSLVWDGGPLPTGSFGQIQGREQG